jgi:hypothetical protein
VPQRRQMSRSEAKELGDFIDPGQAGLVIVGESKVEDAIKHAVTRAEKQTTKELDVSPKTSTRPCRKPSRKCNRQRGYALTYVLGGRKTTLHVVRHATTGLGAREQAMITDRSV